MHLLTVDGVEFEDTASAGVLKLEISGLSEGKHTIATYHNYFGPEATVKTATMDVSINGQLVADDVQAPTRVRDDKDALVLYNEVDVKDGETVEIIFKSNNDGTYNVPALNAIEIDKEHISKRIRYLYPDDGDEHFETDKGFSWTAAADTVSHDVYFGYSYEEVLNADKSSKEYLGSTTANNYAAPDGLAQLTKYYWRVDGVFADGSVCKGVVDEFEIATLAFPSAEGYGRFAKGGRGGRIIEVTNLNDSGPGSLRQALEVETGPRIVIFRVGGIIELKSRITIKGEEHGHVYVAGQTAPGDGITVIKHPLGMMSTEDVIIRNLRVRVGDASGTAYDGMGMASSDHCIIDHCTISWTIDEGFSSRGAKNITFQWNIIAEALNNSVHGKGEHGYAVSISGDTGSFHHNLLVHNAGRNWSMAGNLEQDDQTCAGNLDIRNNVVYNYKNRTTDGGAKRVNFVANYYKKGPSSQTMSIFHIDGGGQLAYMAGNKYTEADGTVLLDPVTGNQLAFTTNNGYYRNEEFFPSLIKEETADEAFDSVLAKAGAIYPKRDYLDTRVVEETRTGTATYTGSVGKNSGIIDSQKDVGGYPNETNFKGGNGPVDYDGDGMPDEWESAHGLDSEDTTDGNEYTLSPEGYTNIEMYLNELAGDTMLWNDYEAVPDTPHTATPAPTAEPTEVPTNTPEPTATPEPVETTTPEPTATNTPEPVLLGDVNGDGSVDASDALLVLKHAVKLERIDEEKSVLADVNKDGNIDASDALRILKIAAKLES